MPLIAIPMVWAIAEALIAATAIVGGIYVVSQVAELIADFVAKELSETASKARECRDCKCPNCIPPVGTIGYQVHWVPPSVAHWPCAGSHVHFYIRRQNPNGCICFWAKEKKKVLCLENNLTPENFNPSDLGSNLHLIPKR